MKSPEMKYFLFLICCSAFNLFGQTNAQNLEAARKYYEEGKLDSAYNLLEASLEKSGASSEKSSAANLKSAGLSLANKSILQRTEPLKSQLALQAFQFYSQEGAYSFESSIYNSLYYAVKSVLGDDYNLFKGHESIRVKQIKKINGQYHSLGDDGRMITWKDTLNGYTREPIEERAKFIWNEARMKIVDFSVDNEYIEHVAINKESKMLVSVGALNFKQIDPSTDEIIEITSEAYDGTLLDMFPVEHGWHVVTSKELIHLTLKNPEQLDQVFSTVQPLNIKALDAIKSKDDYYLLTANGVLGFDIASKEINDIGLIVGKFPTKIAITQDQKSFVIGYASGSIDVFDLGNKERIEEFVGHTSRVSNLQFSQNGKQLISGGFDQVVNVWNMNDLRREPIQFKDHDSFISTLLLDESNNRLLVGEVDGTIKFYNLTPAEDIKKLCGAVSGSLSKEQWSKYLGEDSPYDPYICNP